MFRESMTFLKSVLRHQQQGQNFNKVGILEIPEVVLEELLQNAFVHIDLLHAAAIRLLVFTDRVEIINPGCLFGGLQVEDIKLGVSRQRNPLMATLASKTMIYRGLGSGIIRVMKEGVRVEFVNEESANQFKTIIWRTIQKDESTIQKELTTTQKAVLDYFKKNPMAKREDAIRDIEDITEGGIKFIIGRLQQLGLLKREGGRKHGKWVVIDNNY